MFLLELICDIKGQHSWKETKRDDKYISYVCFCGCTTSHTTPEWKEICDELYTRDEYKRTHLEEFGVKVLWQSDCKWAPSRIAIVPLTFLDDYLRITDAKTSATFNVDSVDDTHVKVTNIWSMGQ